MGGKINNVNQFVTDKIDQAILNELTKNSKIPLRQLAKKINISFVTVMNRIKKLESSGVIKNYSTIIDHDLLGYGIHALIEVRISKGKLFELEKKIARSSNIYAVYDTTGEFDATLLAKFRTTRTLDNFIKKIQTYDFVERTSTKLILNTIKESQITV